MERRGLWLGSVWVRAFVLGCGVGVSVWMFVVSRPFYHDDAYITLRYAHHLLQGQGIVWNLGESLQGYTNFLHLVLIAGLGACGVDLVVASRFVGGGAFAGLLLGVFWLRSVWELPTAQRTFSVQEGAPEALSVQEGAQGAWFLSFVLLLTSAPLVVWSWGGLEGNLFACFVAVGALLVMAASRHPKPLRLASAAGMVLAWSCLVRPEGWLFWGISWLWLGWFVARPLGSVRLFGAYGIGGLLCLVPYLCWQYAYYGELIPNTFYVKVGVPLGLRLGLGVSYFWKYLWWMPCLYLLTLLGWVGWVYRVRKGEDLKELGYLFGLIGAYGVYVVYAGGDHMPSFRFGLPLIPLMCFVGVMAFAGTRLLRDRRWVHGLALCFVGLALYSTKHPMVLPRTTNIAADVGAIVGKYIREAWPKGALVALNTAGSTPYYATEHRYIDMLGLNDRAIARRKVNKIEVPWQRAPGHFKGDGRYVLSRRPDYIIVGPANGTTIDNPWFLSDLEMQRDPRFHAEYEMFRFPLDRQGRVSVNWSILFTYYKRRDTR